MKDNWHNPEFSKKWDTDTARGNPTRPEQLDLLTSIVADNYQPGTLVLDIGSGSGQVEEIIFRKNREIKIIGVDSAKPMIDLAKRRLSQYSGNFEIIEKDVQEFREEDLPEGRFATVFSVQVLHELPHEEKIALMKRVFDLLETNGSFLILDRIKADYRTFEESYTSIWNRLEGLTSLKSNRSYEEHRNNMESKNDYPATAEEHLSLLREAGFEATILHLHFDRALFVGVRL